MGEGVLKLFEDGETKDLLTVPENLACVSVSESGGVVWAYFLDRASRDFYGYNLADGSFAKGNVGQVFFTSLFDIPYAWSSMFVDRLGDYIVIHGIVEMDDDSETEKSLLLKQDGGALNISEPDFSDVPNLNPEGKGLLLVDTGGGYGYIDGTGTARGFYDDASAFYYNERGEGVAFVTVGGEGYFVDKYLNKVSDPITQVNGAFCSKDGVFELYFSDESTKTYTVELVPKDSPGTGGALVYILIAAALVIAVGAVVIVRTKKRDSQNEKS